MLTFHQRALVEKQRERVRFLNEGRKTVKFCKTCGGTHKGFCDLEVTIDGTFARTEVVDLIESYKLQAA